MRFKVLLVFGTRPEAIKMCPLVKELQKHEEIETRVCITAQHREMLDQVLGVFSVKADYDLNIMKSNQTLQGITADILAGLVPILQSEQPSLVLVHGDTTTAFSSALAAYYAKIPVGHVEAGLRTGNIYSPFPEEMSRKLVTHLATVHFAPTESNRLNLLHEGVSENVWVTGNTVIDAFATTVKQDYEFHSAELQKLDFERKIILITAHRRENIGEPLRNICNAILQLAEQNPSLDFVYPVHPNPLVRNTVFSLLGNHKRIFLIEPLDVVDMHNLIARSFLVMTDSGGLQEEVPHFGVPVVVLREETERPEAVEAGVVKVVGTTKSQIVDVTQTIITDSQIYKEMSLAANPYGDGTASVRICEKILQHLGPKDSYGG